MYKPKVLLLQENIVSYRLPVYNIIGKKVALTVAYTNKNEVSDEVNFDIIKLEKTNFKGFYFIKNKFFKFCNNYDVVIFMADLHYLSYCLLPFRKRKFKAIPWTIGIRASYTRLYDVTREKDFVDKVYLRLLKKSDAIIFYMAEAKKFWKGSIDEGKVFIAHNTVKVLETDVQDTSAVKNRILFLGTLYKEKKIYELIEAFIEAKELSMSKSFLFLDIVGKGDEYENIEKIIKEKGLEGSVFLHGPIYDENILSTFFKKSILCISPNQAGLSVLKSMGYGVPFVTKYNAITGGERQNIIHNNNGVFYKKKKDLVNIILDANTNSEKYIKFGENAYKYYQQNSTPQIMANGVLDAINFTLK